MLAPKDRSPAGAGSRRPAASPWADQTDDMEVAVMRGTREGPRTRSRVRLLAVLMLAPGASGCASVTQDVDLYYRQMAHNYQEAVEKARLDAASLENQAKVLAVTGETRKQRKSQRQLDKMRSWEGHCL